MQLTAIVNDKPPKRPWAPELDLLSGSGRELLLVVADAVAVDVPTVLLSLDVSTGYRRDAIVCVSFVATPDTIVVVKNAVMEDWNDDTCIESGSLSCLKPA